MVFSVTTQFQGTAWCSCNAFVWRGDEKVVISDIDGTITRSDVRGMILPKIGNILYNFYEYIMEERAFNAFFLITFSIH